MDWSKAKSLTKKIVANNGQTIQWLQKITSGSDRYNTGSSTTYGYGDQTVYWTTGSFVAIVEPVRETEVKVDAGFSIDDYKRLWIDPDQSYSYLDQLFIPSGSNVKFIILPSREWNAYDSNTTISKILYVRRLIPKSGSVY